MLKNSDTFFVVSQLNVNTLITPKGNHDRAYAPEIIEIRENKRENRWEIDIRRARLEDKLDLDDTDIQSLFPDTAQGKIGSNIYDRLGEFWEAIDQELLRMRIPAAVAERRQNLGITDNEVKYWQLPSGLTEKQKAVLCYFLPYSNSIKNSSEDIAHCLSTFLKTEVKAEFKNIEKVSKQYYTGIAVRDWMIGIHDKIGGNGQAVKPMIVLKVICKTSEVLQNFLPGTRQRTLLENLLIPRFVGRDYDTEVVFEIPQGEGFIIGEEAGTIGYCTIA